MGLFEQFPYLNLHQLNLDWVLNEIKKLSKDVTDLNSAVTEVEAHIDEKTAEILNQWLQDGTLAEIIDTELLNHKVYMFPTFATIETSGLNLGDVIYTSGWASVNDGGSGCYLVSNSGIAKNGVNLYPAEGESYKSFGLAGDGVTDDSEAFQRYINLKVDIDMGSGTFAISRKITLRNNIRIHGQQAMININSGLTDNALEKDSGYNITIEGLRFNGGSPATYRKIISITNASYITIKDCEFTLGFGYAVRLSASHHVKVIGCYFHNIDGITGDPGGGVYSQGVHHAEYIGNRGDDLRDHLIYIDGSVECYNITIKDTECSNSKENPLTNAAAVIMYGNVHDFSIINTKLDNTRSGIGCMERDDACPHDYIIDGVQGLTQLETVIITNANREAPYKTANGIITNVICNSGEDGLMIRYVDGIVIDSVILKAIARNGIGIDGVSNLSASNITAFGAVYTVISMGSRAAVNNVHIRGVKVLGTGLDVLYINRATNCSIKDVIYSGNYSRVTQNPTTTPIHELNITPGVYERSVFSASAIPSSLSQFNNFSQVGDRCLDSTGQTNGWKCTAAGNPGTWAAV